MGAKECGEQGSRTPSLFQRFGLVPEGFHLGARGLGERCSFFAGQTFHGAEAAGKFGRRFFERDFGIDVQETREVYGYEKDVTQFAFDARGIWGFCAEDGLEFVGFFCEFGEDAIDVVPVEADTRSFAGELIGFQESGDVFGDAIENGFGRSLFFGSAGFGAFFLFYDFPITQNVRGSSCAGGAKTCG